MTKVDPEKAADMLERAAQLLVELLADALVVAYPPEEKEGAKDSVMEWYETPRQLGLLITSRIPGPQLDALLLGLAWLEAETALPKGWAVQVVVHQRVHRQPRWAAAAASRDPLRERTGTGLTPAGALLDLAAKLRDLQP